LTYLTSEINAYPHVITRDVKARRGKTETKLAARIVLALQTKHEMRRQGLREHVL
jgi:hypothetical protein